MFSVWCCLLEEASWTEREKVFQGKAITLDPGQLIIGRKQIAVITGAHESSIQRILKKLEIEQQIEQQTGTKSRLITILNWDQYHQGEHQTEQQANNKRTTSEHTRSIKALENDKNKKEHMLNFEQFYSKYPKKVGRKRAEASWSKLNGTTPPIDELITILEKHIASKAWMKDNGEYIPHPTTWLNGHHWEDDVAAEAQHWRFKED